MAIHGHRQCWQCCQTQRGRNFSHRRIDQTLEPAVLSDSPSQTVYPLRWPRIISRARRRNIQNSPNKPPFPPLPIQPQPQPKTEGRAQPNDHSSISPHPHPQPANVIHPLPSSGRTDHATRKEGKKYSVDPWLGVIRPVPRHSSACARRRTNERTHPASAYDRATIYSAHRPRKATPT